MTIRNVALLALLGLPLVAQAGFRTSTHKKDSRKGDNFYAAGAALDSKSETCWQSSPEKGNEGQWIEIDTPSGEIDKVALIIGWDQDENAFFDYARVKKARVEAWSVEGGNDTQVLEAEVTFEDKRGWQIVEVPDTKFGGEFGGGKVRLTVLETYPGKDYPNLAVSEFRVHLKEFAAETLMMEVEPENSADGHGPENLWDGSERTYWASTDNSGTFGFSAKGYGLASVGIKSGPKPHARPKTVKVEANDLEVTHVLEDTDKMQWVLLPVVAGYTGGAWGTAKVTIVDTYEGEKGVAVSEVKINASTLEDF